MVASADIAARFNSRKNTEEKPNGEENASSLLLTEERVRSKVM
jgi:hypothetical protein